MKFHLLIFSMLVLRPALAMVDEENLDNISLEEEPSLTTNDPNKIEPKLDLLKEASTQKKPVYQKSEEEKKALLKRVLSAALRRPGAWTRLGQVLPIVRTMSAPQRLALASLVMAQVVAGPSDPAMPPNLTKESTKNLTSELMLPISADIATMFRGLAKEEVTGRSNVFRPEYMYPGGEKRIRPSGPNIRRPPPTLNVINRRNANVHNPMDMTPPSRRLIPPSRPPITQFNSSQLDEEENCDPVLNSMCLQVSNYPTDSIERTIDDTPNKEAFVSLLTDPLQNTEGEKVVMERRLSDTDESPRGQVCSSKVEMVRPKRARATSGKWKYIVNTGEYTQTLRIELCSKPSAPCNYLSEDIDSQCVQVYNYHRLLTWDEGAGLTMDIFKVPTCCSCHVRGYGGVPFSQVEGSSPKPSDFHDSNLVADETAPVRVTPPKGVRVRPYNPPKRESTGVRRPPAVQHRGPPLPLDNESSQEPRKKFNLQHLTVGPNQRHPALPADVSRYGPVTPPTVRNRPTTQPKKINYSYHPIIDFFRPPTAAAESRMSVDWTPITDQPRALP